MVVSKKKKLIVLRVIPFIWLIPPVPKETVFSSLSYRNMQFIVASHIPNNSVAVSGGPLPPKEHTIAEIVFSLLLSRNTQISYRISFYE
jgi:hypothetical protein